MSRAYVQLRPPVRFVVHPDGVLEHDVDVPEDFAIHLVAGVPSLPL